MHFAMMKAAEAHEVRGFRVATVGPVLDVVGVDVVGVGAAWEAAALVSGP